MDDSRLLFSDGEHELAEGLCWRVPVQCLPGSVVHQIGDAVERLLIVNRQVRPLRQKLPQQAVGILAGAALPGTVRSSPHLTDG